jgi:tetratricopeptide (TPR) repeat protein
VAAAFAFFLISSLASAATFDETFRAGLIALQSNDLSVAESNLQAAAKLQPANGRVWIALARTYRKLNSDSKADEAAAKAARLGGSDEVVLQSLVLYYKGYGDIVRAAETQAALAALAPGHGEAREQAEALYLALVQPLLKQEKFGEAVGILESAKTRLPRSAQIELMLGVACYGLRRFDQAAAAFLETIALSPDQEQPYLFLGRFLDQVPARVPVILTHAVAFETAHPESAAGWLLHARALNAQIAEPEKAAALLEKSLEINGRDVSAQFELGTVYDRLQRYPDAVTAFEKAAALNPSDAAAHYRLARDYDRLGKPEEAKAEREKHASLTATQDAIRR